MQRQQGHTARHKPRPQQHKGWRERTLRKCMHTGISSLRRWCCSGHCASEHAPCSQRGQTARFTVSCLKGQPLLRRAHLPVRQYAGQYTTLPPLPAPPALAAPRPAPPRACCFAATAAAAVAEAMRCSREAFLMLPTARSTTGVACLCGVPSDALSEGERRKTKRRGMAGRGAAGWRCCCAGRATGCPADSAPAAVGCSSCCCAGESCLSRVRERPLLSTCPTTRPGPNSTSCLSHARP